MYEESRDLNCSIYEVDGIDHPYIANYVNPVRTFFGDSIGGGLIFHSRKWK